MNTSSTCARARRRDQGFTLIELLIALTLSLMIGGVVVAALITSLNVSRSTSIQVKDSTDAGLITAYLTRDAQSTGGIVPTTAIRDSTVGVSTAPTGWDGCAQVAPATLVVRFSWIERTTLLAPSSKVVVTYAFDSSKAQLTRRSCRDSTTGPDIVLGRDVVSVVATCDSDCTVAPTTVSLAVTGSGTRAPLSYTLKASLRMDAQAVPTAVNAAPVPLVALGAGAAVSCPNVDLAGTGPVTVVGNAVVDSLCGSTPVRDTSVPALLRPTGATTAIAGVVNPFIARVKPVFTCNPAGLNPAVFGQSASASTIVVYPQSVKITADTVFQPGVYVFCKGLELTSNRVTGSNVLFYIESGSFEAKAAATVDLTGRAASDPTLQKMLVWSAATNVPVTIAGGPRVSNYRGFVYAPNAKIVASSSVGLNVEGLNAQGLTVTGTGQARLGPIPTITVTPTALANGQTNLAYSATMVATGGTAPYTWSATGLPAGLAISAGGVISGTPTAAGTYTFLATAFDATKAAASADVTVTIVAALAISTPSLPNGQVGVAYATTTLAATGGTPPYTWAASGLPPGLALNGSTIAGTPTVPGTYNVVVTATDSSAASVQATYSVTISLPTCAVTAPPWKGQYYPTTTLSGTPVLRDDANINFNWGAGVPIAGIAADNYSVRWTRTTTFAAGNYTFTLDTDDGARMFIDNVAVIDSWTAARASVYTQFLTGVHTLRVEYNEKTGTARAALTTQFASVATVANGVTAVPSVKTNQPFFGELNVTLTNPSDVITAMSASFSIAQTPGVTYHGQYTDLPKSEMTESNQSCVGLVTYGFTLGHGVTIRTPGTWVLAAQWDGTGTPRVTTGDTWSVTTTTSKGTSTVSGTF